MFFTHEISFLRAARGDCVLSQGKMRTSREKRLDSAAGRGERAEKTHQAQYDRLLRPEGANFGWNWRKIRQEMISSDIACEIENGRALKLRPGIF